MQNENNKEELKKLIDTIETEQLVEYILAFTQEMKKLWE